MRVGTEPALADSSYLEGASHRLGEVRVAHLLGIALALSAIGQLGRIPLIQGEERTAPLLLNDLLVLGSVVLGLLVMLRSRSFGIDSVAALGLLFAAVGGASALVQSAEVGLGLRDVAVSLAYLARWLTYFLLYVVGIHVFRRRDVAGVTALLERGVLAFAAFGILQSALLSDFAVTIQPNAGWDVQGRRLVSTLLDPNFAGAWIGVVLLLQMARMSYGVRVPPWRTWLLVVALVLTLSRSSWLMVMVGALVIFFGRGVSRRLLWVFVVLGLLALPLVPALVDLASAYNKLTLGDASAMARFAHWAVALEVLAQNPVFGVGMNTYVFVQQHYLGRGFQQASFGLDGGLLFIAVMTGMVGLALFTGMLLVTVRRCRRIWRSGFHAPAERGLALGVGAVTVALTVHSLFVNSLLYPFLTQTMWILWALVFAVRVPPREESASAEGSWVAGDGRAPDAESGNRGTPT